MLKRDLFEYKNNLIEGFGYSEDMAENLAIMAESFSTIYGDLAYDAIANCKFVQAKRSTKAPIMTVGTVLEDEGVLNDEVKEECKDLRVLVSKYQSKPIINKTQDGYKIQNIKKVIGLSANFNWDNPDSLGHIASEIDRLIGSTNGYMIDGNTLEKKEGLISSTGVLSGSRDVKCNTTSRLGKGLERGINDYTAQKLIISEYGMEYTPISFAYERLIAGYMLDHLGLEDTIRSSRITKDTSQLESVISTTYPGGYNQLLSDIDNLYDLEIKRNNVIGDASKTVDIDDEMSRVYAEVAEKINKMEVNLVKDEKSKVI